MPNLEDSLCKVFKHDWDYTGSGESMRPKCKRCKADFIDWAEKQGLLGVDARGIMRWKRADTGD